METNQEGKQSSFRFIGGTALNYNGDAVAAFQAQGATSNNYNEAFIQWLQIRASSAQTNVNDLAALFANQLGFDSWDAVNTIDFVPLQLPNLTMWLDSADETTFTFNYQSIVETAAGTISTNTITASADVSGKIEIGNEIRIAGTDLYTVANVVTTTITTVESLVATYVANTIEIAHISQQDNKAPPAIDVSEGTATNQPTLARNKINGLSTVRYDGINDRLFTADNINLGSNITVFCVGKFSIVSPNAFFMEQSITVGANDGFQLNGNGIRPAVIRNDGFSTFPAANPQWMGINDAIGSMIFDGLTLRYFLDAAEVDSVINARSNNNVADNLYIGGRSTSSTFNTDGFLGEVIIYNRTLCAMELSLVHTYLSDKWGITI